MLLFFFIFFLTTKKYFEISHVLVVIIIINIYIKYHLINDDVEDDVDFAQTFKIHSIAVHVSVVITITAQTYKCK